MAFKRIKKVFRTEAPNEAVAIFAFCEGVWATSCSTWHIRQLSEVGLKTGGGIDTKSLCGHVTPKIGGWDLEVPITDHHLTHSCNRCTTLYKKLRL